MKARPRSGIALASRPGIMYLFLLLLLLAVIFISILLGKYRVSAGEVVDILLRKLLGRPQTWSNNTNVALFNIRIPRICVAALVGAALSMAGLVYQALFRNPMVSPDILGASTGSAFGACTALMLTLSAMGVQTMAFCMGILAVAICYAVARLVSRGGDMPFTLILTGMVVSTMFSSMISIIKFIADPDNKLPAITFWMMGGLSSVVASKVPMVMAVIIPSMLPVILLRWQLNVISFGDEEAKALGTNVRLVRIILIFAATLLTAATVSVAGMVGWVGLVVPHITRMLMGNNYRRSIPASVLIGAIFMILVDDIARCAFLVEIPLGIITGLIGGPFFIFLLFQKGKRNRETGNM